MLHRLGEVESELNQDDIKLQQLSEKLSTVLESLERGLFDHEGKTEAQVKHLEFRQLKLAE